MGYKLVNQAAAWAAHLTPVERTALQYMANQAKDDDAPPIYWAGWQGVAKALGYAAVGAKQTTAEANANAVLGRLQKKGVTTSSGGARPGKRAHYALNLDPSTVHVCTWFSADGRTSTWEARPRVDPRAPKHRGFADWAGGESPEEEPPRGMGSESDYPMASENGYTLGSESDYPYSMNSSELHQVGKGEGATHSADPVPVPVQGGEERSPVTEEEGPPQGREDGGAWTGWGNPAATEEVDPDPSPVSPVKPPPSPTVPAGPLGLFADDPEEDPRTLQERADDQAARLHAKYPDMFAA